MEVPATLGIALLARHFAPPPLTSPKARTKVVEGLQRVHGLRRKARSEGREESSDDRDEQKIVSYNEEVKNV